MQCNEKIVVVQVTQDIILKHLLFPNRKLSIEKENLLDHMTTSDSLNSRILFESSSSISSSFCSSNNSCESWHCCTSILNSLSNMWGGITTFSFAIF